MLKITKVQIELFTDINMVLMTEKGIRGGLTQVIRKHGIANNKAMIVVKRVLIFNIWMQIIYMAMLLIKSYH